MRARRLVLAAAVAVGGSGCGLTLVIPPPGRMGAPSPWTQAEAPLSGDAGASAPLWLDEEEGAALPLTLEASADWVLEDGRWVLPASGTLGPTWVGVRPGLGARWRWDSGLAVGLGLTATAGLGTLGTVRPYRDPYLGIGAQTQVAWRTGRNWVLSATAGLEGVAHLATFTAAEGELEPDVYSLPWFWPHLTLRLDAPLNEHVGLWGGLGLPGMFSAGVRF